MSGDRAQYPVVLPDMRLFLIAVKHYAEAAIKVFILSLIVALLL